MQLGFRLPCVHLLLRVLLYSYGYHTKKKEWLENYCKLDIAMCLYVTALNEQNSSKRWVSWHTALVFWCLNRFQFISYNAIWYNVIWYYKWNGMEYILFSAARLYSTLPIQKREAIRLHIIKFMRVLRLMEIFLHTVNKLIIYIHTFCYYLRYWLVIFG